MQTALPDGVTILGVNGIGFEDGNDSITAERSLPWLQDTPEVGMWAQWQVGYRDVVVRDPEGKMFGVFNLSTNSLENADNVAALTDMALDAAAVSAE